MDVGSAKVPPPPVISMVEEVVVDTGKEDEDPHTEAVQKLLQAEGQQSEHLPEKNPTLFTETGDRRDTPNDGTTEEAEPVEVSRRDNVENRDAESHPSVPTGTGKTTDGDCGNKRGTTDNDIATEAKVRGSETRNHKNTRSYTKRNVP